MKNSRSKKLLLNHPSSLIQRCMADAIKPCRAGNKVMHALFVNSDSARSGKNRIPVEKRVDAAIDHSSGRNNYLAVLINEPHT